MAQDTLRVLGIAYREVPDKIAYSEDTIENSMVFSVCRHDGSPRGEAIEATKVCNEVGIRPIMITGDHKLTAVAIARK